MMKTDTAIVFLAFFSCSTTARAVVNFDWATVGNPGNAADQDYGGPGDPLGAVANTYRISKHEVTNDQYAEFLNAMAATDSFGGADPTLYNPLMDIIQSGSPGSFTYTVNSGFGPNPVTYVSFLDSMRFVNWLENGQGSGSTESGVYTIGDGTSETRSASASFFIPSEDEWYKAAYYDPRLAAVGGPPGDDNYWLYPTQSDTEPSCVVPPGAANSANCGLVGDTTDVGAYTNTTNFYGTFDQSGNVQEWNETLFPFGLRGLRGGHWNSGGGFGSAASSQQRFNGPTFEIPTAGFRVASIAEPRLDCDFSGDGFCNVIDLDLMQSLGPIAPGVPAPGNEEFDQDGDGTIDLRDRDLWLAAAATENGLASPYKIGDANLDGVVDVSDFNIWNTQKFTANLLWSAGEFGGDGSVDVSDFNQWNLNKFTSSGGAAAVPEPTSGMLSLFAMLLLGAAGKWRWG